MVSVDDGLDFLYLSEIQFACEDDDIGELCVESQRLGVRDAELCGYMYFHADLAGIYDCRHVGCNHSSDSG